MYTAKKFNIPKLDGISEKQVAEHVKLYEGYVKHTNTIIEQVDAWIKNGYEKNQYIIKELWRRLPFEFDGMRSHEFYFGALAHGARPLDPKSAFGKKVEERFDGFDGLAMVLKNVASTRGNGWVMLYWDLVTSRFLVGWVDEHHIGHLTSLPVVLAIDCWEHAYLLDYLPVERVLYLDAYLKNVNWDVPCALYERTIANC